MKAKWVFSVVAIISVVLALSPLVAYADTGTTAGQFQCGNSAPTITTIVLQNDGETGNVSDITPQTRYVVELTAGDANTVDDIKQIDFWIFLDDDAGGNGAPNGSWDCDHEAIYKWVKSGNVWSMQNSSAVTTWSITTGSCDIPGVMTGTSGEWNLYFNVSKIAQEANGTAAEWDIKVTVTDDANANVSSTIYSKSMGAYSSLVVSDAAIDFGTIALGGTAAIQTPGDQNVGLQALSNDVFALGSHTTATWANASITTNLNVSGTPGASNEFAITLDDAGSGGHPVTPQALTTTTAATITGHATDARTGTAAGASEATVNTDIYMDCKLNSSGIQPGIYTGTITFTITNS